MGTTWEQNAAEVRAALMGLDHQPEADKAVAALDEMRAQYERCHAELLAIHVITSCGWANVLSYPISPDDTLTVRDVKVMALVLIKNLPLKLDFDIENVEEWGKAEHG